MQRKSNKPKLFDFRRLPMDIARLVCSPLLLLYRVKRLTPEGEPYRLRIRDGAILAANHTSFADAFVLGVTVWYRRMFFMAAEVVMKGKLRSWLLKGVGAIRVDRNQADIEAIRQSVGVLKEGHLLAVFPQGGIVSGNQIQTIKSGVVLIALQAGVPIIPMYICPRKRWYDRKTVVIGKTLNLNEYIQKKFPSTADIAYISQKLLEEMNRCAMYQQGEKICKQ